MSRGQQPVLRQRPTVAPVRAASWVMIAGALACLAGAHLPRLFGAPPGPDQVGPYTAQSFVLVAVPMMSPIFAEQPLRRWRLYTAFSCSVGLFGLSLYDLGRLDAWVKGHAGEHVIPGVGWWLLFVGPILMMVALAWTLARPTDDVSTEFW